MDGSSEKFDSRSSRFLNDHVAACMVQNVITPSWFLLQRHCEDVASRSATISLQCIEHASSSQGGSILEGA
jgi:hypothetical protein